MNTNHDALRKAQTHELKTWPEYFEAIVSGEKTFELRKDDRDFQVGDALLLREWDPITREYTGKSTRRMVSYILRNAWFGIADGYVVLSLSQPMPEAAAQGWIPVDRQMPRSGQIVLALQKWDHSGKLGVIRAAWVAAKTEESSPESDIGEYDEATDTYYDPEGWYEQISHWDEISAAGVSGATIVAWMPLPGVLSASPAAPEGAKPDNWQQYAQDGENAQECIERHRKEQDALLELLKNARRPYSGNEEMKL